MRDWYHLLHRLAVVRHLVGLESGLAVDVLLRVDGEKRATPREWHDDGVAQHPLPCDEHHVATDLAKVGPHLILEDGEDAVRVALALRCSGGVGHSSGSATGVIEIVGNGS